MKVQIETKVNILRILLFAYWKNIWHGEPCDKNLTMLGDEE